jgi:hypothetical protein
MAQQCSDALDDGACQDPWRDLSGRAGHERRAAQPGFDREADRVEHGAKSSPSETRLDEQTRCNPARRWTD